MNTKKQQQIIEKQQQKQKQWQRQQQMLQQRQQQLHTASSVIDLLSAAYNCYRDGFIIACVDWEFYEQQHDIILEIGCTTLKYNNNNPSFYNYHWIIEENEYYHNQYVPSLRYDFNHGQSCTTDLHSALRQLFNILRKQNTIYVGHGVGPKSLDRRHGLCHFASLPSIVNPIDTQLLFSAVSNHHFKRLSYVCNHFGISVNNLHNAGNDAHATALCFHAITQQYKQQFC